MAVYYRDSQMGKPRRSSHAMGDVVTSDVENGGRALLAIGHVVRPVSPVHL